jgi:hypothetical protein
MGDSAGSLACLHLITPLLPPSSRTHRSLSRHDSPACPILHLGRRRARPMRAAVRAARRAAAAIARQLPPARADALAHPSAGWPGRRARRGRDPAAPRGAAADCAGAGADIRALAATEPAQHPARQRTRGRPARPVWPSRTCRACPCRACERVARCGADRARTRRTRINRSNIMSRAIIAPAPAAR